jgi:hypothetical protein
MLRVSNLKDCRGMVIKFFKIKYNLIKKIFYFCFLKINIKVKRHKCKENSDEIKNRGLISLLTA